MPIRYLSADSISYTPGTFYVSNPIALNHSKLKILCLSEVLFLFLCPGKDLKHLLCRHDVRQEPLEVAGRVIPEMVNISAPVTELGLQRRGTEDSII